jgi:DNA-binding CsgD family transcriptional regulator
MLIGREAECVAIEGMLRLAVEGRSGSLVVRGEAGIGKTALLEHAQREAVGMRVTRWAGIESEVHLGFAALHYLLLPCIPRMDGLPAPQRGALGSAFGLVAGVSPDRFLIALATLTLLSEAAHEQPILVVVDDAEWLDQESAEVLGFVARRLDADPVVLLLAAREPAERDLPFQMLPELRLPGLAQMQVRQLLESVAPGPVDGDVAHSIAAETGGNPLAIQEIAAQLSAEQLAGTSPLPRPLPSSGSLREMYLGRVRELPADSQELLLLAAAGASSSAARIWNAATHLGIPADAAGPAEREQLLSVSPEMGFRHPLIRSAVYHGASAADRRRVHRALAETSTSENDADQRAWDYALAAPEPDEGIASALESSAVQARRRGGYVAAAACLTRAAELTPDPVRRADRLLKAAQAELVAGAPHRAQLLLDRMQTAPSNPLEQARAIGLQGRIRYARGQLSQTPAIFLQSARALLELDVRLARDTLLEGAEAAIWAGSLAGSQVAEIADVAREVPIAPLSRRAAIDPLLDGLALRLAGDYPASVPPLQRGVSALLADDLTPEQGLRWRGLGALCASELFRSDAQEQLARKWVSLARSQGALILLPTALAYAAFVDVLAGRVAAAEGALAEAREIALATANGGVLGSTLPVAALIAAWRGRATEVQTAVTQVMHESIEGGRGGTIALAEYARAVLENSFGNYSRAFGHASRVFRDSPFRLNSLVLPDLIEAAVRSGDLETAGSAADVLAKRAVAAATPWALGLLARSQALLVGGDDAEPFYQDAVDRLSTTAMVPDVARAHLLYGEWLRRQRRRRDSRVQLERALQLFDGIGAAGFSERARKELAASGSRTPTRSESPDEQMTPREAEIGRMAAEGLRNSDIAAQLFLSPSTVDYHLRHVYRKFGVTSRTQLARLLLEHEQRDATRPS